jgi:hypothetical protein
MKGLIVVLLASSAFASELLVPVGARAPVEARKAIAQISLRDPSLVRVVVTDGAVALEGKKSGVTAITVEYADRELERVLVVVGDGQNAMGMSAERAVTIDLKQNAKAQAKVARPTLLRRKL